MVRFPPYDCDQRGESGGRSQLKGAHRLFRCMITDTLEKYKQNASVKFAKLLKEGFYELQIQALKFSNKFCLGRKSFV